MADEMYKACSIHDRKGKTNTKFFVGQSKGRDNVGHLHIKRDLLQTSISLPWPLRHSSSATT